MVSSGPSYYSHWCVPGCGPSLWEESGPMKRNWLLLTSYLVLMTDPMVMSQERPAGDAVSKHGPSPEGWDLVWADEFDKDVRPDPRNWNCDTGFLRNRELQW